MGLPIAAHLAEETLLAHARDKLGAGAGAAVAGHLRDCPDCARPLAALPPRHGPDTTGSSAAWPRVIAPPLDLAELHDYELLGELGGNGTVRAYLAYNRLMGRREVLKVLGRAITEQPDFLGKYMEEISAAADLQHSNIVTAYSAFRCGDAVVYPVEYFEGLDLARLVQAKAPLPVSRACYFVYQAARALQYAHEQGLVHRDIKPGHLVVSCDHDRPVVKVLEFGLAKAAAETGLLRPWRDGAGNQAAGDRLPGAEVISGTADYIAPEQIADPERADIRADVYSLGCTLYHLLSGRQPFVAASISEAFQAHHSMDARPLNLVRPQVPVELAALVAKMMAKEPEGRFQTPAAAALALTPFFSKKTARAHAVSPGFSADDMPLSPAAPIEPTSDIGKLLELAARVLESETLTKPKPTRGARRLRWTAALLGPAVVASSLGAALYLVPRGAKRNPQVPALTVLRPVVPTVFDPRQVAPAKPLTSISSSLPDLPENPFAPAPPPVEDPAPPTPVAQPELPPAWKWRNEKYILEAEEGALAAAMETARRYSEYVSAQEKWKNYVQTSKAESLQFSVYLAELNQDEYLLKLWVEQLRQSQASKREERDRAASWGRSGFLDQYIKQLDDEISRMNNAERDLSSRLDSIKAEKSKLQPQSTQTQQTMDGPSPVERLESKRRSSLNAYILALRLFRQQVDQTNELYAKHKSHPKVQAEVNAKNQAGGRARFAVGPSAYFQTIEQKLKDHERWIEAVDTKRSHARGKRG